MIEFKSIEGHVEITFKTGHNYLPELLEEFKHFLAACGYGIDSADDLQLIKREDRIKKPLIDDLVTISKEDLLTASDNSLLVLLDKHDLPYINENFWAKLQELSR